MRQPTQLAILLLSLFLVAPATAQWKRPPKPIPCASDITPLAYSDGELQGIFQTYNRMYWSGRLPATVVVWAGMEKSYGETDLLPDGRYIIRLDILRNREGNVIRTTLLHEMCHVKTWGKDDKNPHGSIWLAELHRIMLEGAFDDIV